MQLIYGRICEQGVGRSKNQDSMLFRQGSIAGNNIYIAAVCDGVGAFPESDFASRFVTEYLDEWFDSLAYMRLSQKGSARKNAKLIYEELKNKLREKLWVAHQLVVDETARTNASAATTVCVILVVENLYCIYNSGDSRAYEITGKVRRLTIDQTTEKNGRTVLSNCLGCFPGPNFARIEGKIKKNSAYLLASDGFYRKWNETELVNMLKKVKLSENLIKVMRDLYEYALANGEKDDSTGIVLKFI